jgi:hypothetical protein
VTGSAWANPFRTRDIVLGTNLRRDRLKNRLDGFPSRFATTGHQAWALESSFFSTRNTRTDEEKSFALDVLGSPFGVDVVGVPAIDKDVAWFKMRKELFDKIIDSGTTITEANLTLWL